MTVAELIAALSAMPPDARAVLPGYEGGLDDVGAVQVTGLRLHIGASWYCGEHEYAEEGEAGEAQGVVILAKKRADT